MSNFISGDPPGPPKRISTRVNNSVNSASGQSQTADPYWQAKKTNIRDRHAAILNNNLMSDVTFLVGACRERIYAHKFVLSIGSSVFYDMFFGKKVENVSEIEIPDIEPPAFLEFLRFIYCDKVQLLNRNAFQILHTAKKYLVPVLIHKCTRFLIRNTSASNVCHLLDQAIIYDEPNFQPGYLHVIGYNVEQSLSPETLKKIRISTLKTILSRETLDSSEDFIFKAAVKWANYECMRQNLQPTPHNLRTVLHDVLYLIRFPTMSSADFANGPVQSKILTPEETVDVFCYLAGRHEATLKFPTKTRSLRQAHDLAVPHL